MCRHYVRVIFCPGDIMSGWYFVRVTLCPGIYCPGDILSYIPFVSEVPEAAFSWLTYNTGCCAICPVSVTCTCTYMMMDNQAQCFSTSISLQCLSRALLILFVDVASTTYCERSFHSLTTRLLKKNFITSSLDRFLTLFMLCALRLFWLALIWNYCLLPILSFPLRILYFY